MFTLCTKKVATFLFFNNFVQNKPMWIIFGTQNPEEILHKYFLKLFATPEKCCHCTLRNAENIIFNSNSTWTCSQSMKSRLFLHQRKINCSYHVNLQNNLMYTSVATEKRDMCINQLPCMHPIPLSATSLWVEFQYSVVDSSNDWLK